MALVVRGNFLESEMMLEWAAGQTAEITTAHQSSIPADCDEPGARSTKPGVCSAADAYGVDGFHEWRGKRHCRQLAEEPIGGMAENAEAI